MIGLHEFLRQQWTTLNKNPFLLLELLTAVILPRAFHDVYHFSKRNRSYFAPIPQDGHLGGRLYVSIAKAAVFSNESQGLIMQ